MYVLRTKNIVRRATPCPMRQGVEAVVMSLIALALVVTWQVEWFIVPTGSMADALVGLHRDMTCSKCGDAFACGADEAAMPGKRAVCPNCGSAAQELESVPPAEGDRILVHRAAFLVRRPRRWEPAAFRDPSRASEVFVKRIAGLPGETIEIRAGDVFADDVIQRKTLTGFRSLAILVHDAAFKPPPNDGLPDRWLGEQGDTRWEAVGGMYRCHAVSEPNDERGARSAERGTDSDVSTSSALRAPRSSLIGSPTAIGGSGRAGRAKPRKSRSMTAMATTRPVRSSSRTRSAICCWCAGCVRGESDGWHCSRPTARRNSFSNSTQPRAAASCFTIRS